MIYNWILKRTCQRHRHFWYERKKKIEILAAVRVNSRRLFFLLQTQIHLAIYLHIPFPIKQVFPNDFKTTNRIQRNIVSIFININKTNEFYYDRRNLNKLVSRSFMLSLCFVFSWGNAWLMSGNQCKFFAFHFFLLLCFRNLPSYLIHIIHVRFW